MVSMGTQLDKLGAGPWTVETVLGPDDSTMVGDLAGVEETRGCACCGNTRLKWRAVLRSNTTGKGFFVGLTCARRAGGDVGGTGALCAPIPPTGFPRSP